ncbi:DNA repair protein RAD5 [Lachnellula hyalina]|uniref:DNA repair protein RAD5 n=1 Tax=Lachnellula hyalina TaxID=1316788 RepID=A0A8H8R3S2_9HELO|nr:DNA repair protein RAD5 [Lachnellula hyalina]TVY27903.1 DNA repair protein RAD5 [Lachnellula hyalina]
MGIGEPAGKRQRLNDSGEGRIGQLLGRPSVANWDSSFSFDMPPAISNPSNPSMALDITKYIPVGCLRIHRSKCSISAEHWESCSTWATFAHPQDLFKPTGQYLSGTIQGALLNSPVLSHFRGLHYAGWIKMEFKSQGSCFGQARVFILPDDVGRVSISRESLVLRRSMQQLLSILDVSRATWRGEWSDDIPVTHIDSTLDEDKVEENISLFHLFNTLPSPNPDPKAIADGYAKHAMCKILGSDIEGLKTTMYNYQRRSAAMMLQREVQPGQTLDPRLKCLEDQRGATWYCELDAGSCRTEARIYEAARGGICAETMGLGKTLICLALILATRDVPSQIPVEYSVGTIPVRKSTGSLGNMAAAAVGRTATPWKTYLSDMQGGYTHETCVDLIKRNAGHYYLPSPAPRRQSRNPVIIPPRKIWLTAATLVIVPANLVKQWCHEIKKHTTGLKCLIMDDKKKSLPPPEELADFDIILFSKSRFELEAKDGSDNSGRRMTATRIICRCPYIRGTRERDCTCLKEEAVYHSPLKSLHFKRLITDEGHTFGNASANSRTIAVGVVDLLQLDARWIVSGTPTQGLYGAEVTISSNSSSTIGTPLLDADDNNSAIMEELEHLEDDIASNSSKEREMLFHLQERKDLEKLGNIASVYLKARPWAPSSHDTASWAQHVMQPRHGAKSQGNMECLRNTLESMMIRHRPGDVEREVQLPPLYQDVVYLDGSLPDTLSLNTFSMMIICNAVTSERKDADYFFHPRQRLHLQSLVSKLRQASFFWSGFTKEAINATIDIAKDFLEKREVVVSQEDENLLKMAIEVGNVILKNRTSGAIRKFHEMPMYVQNEMPEEVRLAWALDEDSRNPTLMGATMIHEAQKFVESQLWKHDPSEGMIAAGEKAMRATLLAQESPPDDTSPRKSKKNGRNSTGAALDSAPALAGGVAIGDGSSLKKRPLLKPISAESIRDMLHTAESSFGEAFEEGGLEQDAAGSNKHEAGDSPTKPKPSLKKSKKAENTGTLDPSSSLASAAIISTASAKLSYLMDRIQVHHEDEKILVFYEENNVAYYIAQALECLGIKYLIYAKTLSKARLSQYIVTFNQTETFRVLLMDVSQAAFGLDMSSASRVYFVNPVFSRQVEAQAVKRAHRIGQTKPVYVETLVLKGSIEELILERRKNITNEEHNKMKNILDDQAIYDWIRDVQFLPVAVEDMPGPEHMAKLRTPQSVFGRGSGAILHPDADLLMGDSTLDGGSKTSVEGETLPGGKWKVFEESVHPSIREIEGYEYVRSNPIHAVYKRRNPGPSKAVVFDSTKPAESIVYTPLYDPPFDATLEEEKELRDVLRSARLKRDSDEAFPEKDSSDDSTSSDSTSSTKRKAIAFDDNEPYEFTNRPVKQQVRFEASPVSRSDIPSSFFSAHSGKGKGRE